MWCVLRHSSIVCWENEADEHTSAPSETIEIKMVHIMLYILLSAKSQQLIAKVLSNSHVRSPPADVDLLSR
jgi:hypothetical protein